MNAEKGKYCPHIEAQLPRQKKRSVRASVRLDNLDRFRESEIYSEPKLENWKRIVDHLQELNFSTQEIELIIGRYLDGYTFRELTAEMGTLSPHYIHKKVLKRLREDWDL